MLSAIIDFLINLVVVSISAVGYPSVFLLMLLESCGFPIPSEVIMPFSGFLVTNGNFNFWVVVMLGTVGNLAGSLIAYWIGLKGGRPFLEKYGKYILISHHDLDIADRWFLKWGEATVFFGRLLPVIRTFVSFPAGIAKMDLKRFSLYTFVGCLPWAILFTWLGVKMGDNWEVIQQTLHNFDVLIAVLVVGGLAGWIYRHHKHRRQDTI